MRYLGVDVGLRRCGLALSDASGVLARPWTRVLAGGSALETARAIVRAMETVADPLDGTDAIGAVVVGLPRRLSGEESDLTRHARAVADALRSMTGLDVALQDERLTSREAEAQLAVHQRDWRRRKEHVDALAAAIVLQDFLDARQAHPSSHPVEPC